MKRSEIRSAVAAQIATAYNGKITSDRRFDSTNEKQFVLVSVPTGVVENDGVSQHEKTTLEVAIHLSGIATDDDLDALGEQVEQGLFSDPSLGGLAMGILYQGFEYLIDEADQFSVLELRYQVLH